MSRKSYRVAYTGNARFKENMLEHGHKGILEIRTTDCELPISYWLRDFPDSIHVLAPGKLEGRIVWQILDVKKAHIVSTCKRKEMLCA